MAEAAKDTAKSICNIDDLSRVLLETDDREVSSVLMAGPRHHMYARCTIHTLEYGLGIILAHSTTVTERAKYVHTCLVAAML